jgi:hypothetical protein
MSAYTSDCPPLDACGPCGTLPAGFVRLRYFFGKRMGVADFVDEQRYHASKQRFHNQRLHGAGVLCGLAVVRQDATDVILRVGKGAAVDACGREIVVGYDQCIELGAWFQRALEERRDTDATWPASALDPAGGLPLVVALRYRDCAAAPEPAPRDTCSCDAAGCDFGRVREEFELALFTADEPEVAASALPLTPPRAELEHVVGRALGGGTLARGLASAASEACPEPAADGWLVLASFTATLTTSGTELELTGLGAVEHRASLLAQSALLQDLLVRELGAHLEAGALNDGPEAIAMSIETEPAPGTEHRLHIDLSGSLVGETVPKGAFTLSRLVPTGAAAGWTAIECATKYEPATATAPPRLTVHVDKAKLVKDGLYRLALDPKEVPMSMPIVDDRMRPFRPLRGVFQFALGQQGTALTLVAPPYAR